MELREIKTLLVEDDQNDVELVLRFLKKSSTANFLVETTDHLTKTLERLKSEDYDIILLALSLPDSDGISTFESVFEAAPSIPIIVLTGRKTQKVGEQTVKQGAQDYMLKNELSQNSLIRSILYGIERKHAQLELQEAKAALEKNNQVLTDDLMLSAETQRACLSELPKKSFIKTSVQYYPHSLVSGDIYDATTNEHDFFNLFLGDVTGHSVSAALITMMAKMALEHISTYIDPKKVLEQINTKFVGSLPGDMFMTSIYLRITPEGRVTLSGAGHPPAIVIPKEGPASVLDHPGGIPLGMFTDTIPYEEQEYRLEHEDRLFIYTDGITEVINENKELFGQQRLIQFLEDHRDKDIDTLTDLLISTLKEYAHGGEFDDDVTIIGVEYLDPQGLSAQKLQLEEKRRKNLVDKLKYLKQSRLFRHTPDRLLERLVPVSRYEVMPPGSQLLEEGQLNYKLFILLKGTVDIYADNEFIISLKRLGDIFGEMSIIRNTPCSATVVSKTEVELLVIDSSEARLYSSTDMDDLPSVFNNVFSMILSEKLVVTTSKAKMLELMNRNLAREKNILEHSYGVLSQSTRVFSNDLHVSLQPIQDQLRQLNDPNRLPDKEEIAHIAQQLEHALHHCLDLTEQLQDASDKEPTDL